MKNICLTFDYELFFGSKSGTIQNSILKPTDAILKTLNANGQKGTFFIDAMFLERLFDIKEEESSYKQITDQLIFMISSGHRIELHLHSHWLDATYANGLWNFPHYKHYRLHSLPEQLITDLFVRCTQLLEEIARKANSSYKIKAFRAGGWSIQPFEKIKEGFIKAGIIIDSSVAPGLKEVGDRSYDFLNSPNKEFWSFSVNPLLEDKQGEFWEVPIHVYKRSFYDRLNKYLYNKYKKDDVFGDGKGLLGKQKNKLSYNLKNKFGSTLSMLTSDSINGKEISQAIGKSSKENVVIINHPKSMLQKQGLNNYKILKKFNTILLIDAIKY